MMLLHKLPLKHCTIAIWMAEELLFPLPGPEKTGRWAEDSIEAAGVAIFAGDLTAIAKAEATGAGRFMLACRDNCQVVADAAS